MSVFCIVIVNLLVYLLLVPLLMDVVLCSIEHIHAHEFFEVEYWRVVKMYCIW